MMTMKPGAILLLLVLLSPPSQVAAAPDSFEIDLKELDQQKPKAPAPKPEKKRTKEVKKPEKVKKAKTPEKAKKVKKAPEAPASPKMRQDAATSGYHRYTIKPGDHIFKILMGPFGLSNEAAEALIPEIIRINKISNIKKLQVGDTLLIPVLDRKRAVKPTEEEKAPTREKAPSSEKVREPEPKREQEPEPKREKEPEPKREKEPEPKREKEPEPKREKEPEPKREKEPELIPVPQQSTRTWPVTDSDPAKMVDAMLTSLSLHWSKNKIVKSNGTEPDAFSIRVDRYFEHRGVRYIVSIGESDPYGYTLLRLLETAGYRVLTVSAGDDFNSIGEKLSKLGLAPDFGKQAPQEGGK